MFNGDAGVVFKNPPRRSSMYAVSYTHLYDVVAGTFMVVGLTDDSFGSLTVEEMQKFSDHFKVPEQFVKLGDKIVAIPMISKEQQKQESIEQKDFEMNADTSGLTVAGHIGTWHTIDQHEVVGRCV